MKRYHIGIDIGGTFTDIVIFDSLNGDLRVIKVPSTTNPEEAVIRAISSLNIEGEDIRIINHATTVATNALLTKKGLPKAALITNRGFRDVLEIGRQRRAEVYNLNFMRPPPLIPRKYRYTVKCRILSNGDIYEDLDFKDLARIKRSIEEENIETIAVSFLNSHINSVHEKMVKDYFSEFRCRVFISSEVDPQYREYERTSTTVVNAVLSPVVSGYLERLRDGIHSLGISAPVYVMGSNGGLNTITYASRMPISIIESGPGAGVVASLHLAKTLGIENVITFDMGGTTAKAGAIVKGKVEISTEFEAAGKTHSGRSIKGSGYTVRYPFIDLAEVSAGGGTIARVDSGGYLQVGPDSAGSFPGPAAYNRGGNDPTVTDANIILGRLNPDHLLGGKMKLYPQLSFIAMERVAAPLSVDTVEAATGVIRIVNNKMSRAISLVSLERGRDPRDFTLFSFGGAGPVHSCDLADEMGIREIIVPRNPGLFSAFGLLTVDISRVFISPPSGNDVDDTFRTLEKKALDSFREDNIESIEFTRLVDLRYRGQSYEITVDYLNGENMYERFADEHRRLYGYSSPDPVEVVNLRVVATARVPKAVFPVAKMEKIEPIKKRRMVKYGDEFLDVDVYLRETLNPEISGSGPAVIEGYDSTVVINPGWKWEVDRYLNILLRR